MIYTDKGDRMANIYSLSRCTWKWTKKLFFHLLDLAVLNSYILLSSCHGRKTSHREFRFAPVRNMLAHTGKEPRVHRPPGRPANVVSKVSRLGTGGGKHRPLPSNRPLCRVFSARGVTRKVSVCVKCQKCEKLILGISHQKAALEVLRFQHPSQTVDSTEL
jgi:hypothetical protein